jgi:hypothetical protein
MPATGLIVSPVSMPASWLCLPESLGVQLHTEPRLSGARLSSPASTILRRSNGIGRRSSPGYSNRSNVNRKAAAPRRRARSSRKDGTPSSPHTTTSRSIRNELAWRDPLRSGLGRSPRNIIAASFTACLRPARGWTCHAHTRSPRPATRALANAQEAHLWQARKPAGYRPKTKSIDAVDVFFSSGACGMTLFGCREPTSTATYCLPFTA